MRHRASRSYAVVATLLLALSALGIAAGVASLTSSSSAPVAAESTRAHDGRRARQEAFVARAAATASRTARGHASGPHLDITASFAALVATALLLFGWLVAGRTRYLLPRRVGAPSAARAPPALV